jgi:hypothetical protein
MKTILYLSSIALLFAVSGCKPKQIEANFSPEDIAFGIGAELFYFQLPDDGAGKGRYALEAFTEKEVLYSRKLSEQFKSKDHLLIILQKEPYKISIAKKGFTSSTSGFDFGDRSLQLWDTYNPSRPLPLGGCFAVFSKDVGCSNPPQGDELGLRLVLLED